MALPEYRSVLRYFVFLIVLMSLFPCRDRDVCPHQIRIARADRPHPSVNRLGSASASGKVLLI